MTSFRIKLFALEMRGAFVHVFGEPTCNWGLQPLCSPVFLSRQKVTILSWWKWKHENFYLNKLALNMQARPWYLISILANLGLLTSWLCLWNHNKQVLFAAFAGSPISIILSDDEFKLNTVPGSYSALSAVGHSLKEIESWGNQWSPGKKH